MLVRLFAGVDKAVLGNTALDLAVDLFGLEFHTECRAVFINLDLEPFGQRVSDRRADAVQTARVRVVTAVELAAGVKLSKYDFHARNAELRMNIYGNTAPVVLDRRASVGVNSYDDTRRKTVGHLVDRVVNYLP